MIYVINYTLKINCFHLYKKHNMTTQEALVPFVQHLLQQTTHSRQINFNRVFNNLTLKFLYDLK